MKRYYVCDIVGTGTRNDKYRSRIWDYGFTHTEVFATDADNRPTSSWALVLVDTVNHTRLLADPQLDALPDVSLDAKVSAINATTRSDMVAKLTGRGIDTAFIGRADSYREVIQTLGQRLDANFDVKNLNVKA